jgi:hypothetical protein
MLRRSGDVDDSGVSGVDVDVDVDVLHNSTGVDNDINVGVNVPVPAAADEGTPSSGALASDAHTWLRALNAWARQNVHTWLAQPSFDNDDDDDDEDVHGEDDSDDVARRNQRQRRRRRKRGGAPLFGYGYAPAMRGRTVVCVARKRLLQILHFVSRREEPIIVANFTCHGSSSPLRASVCATSHF